jgi:hypothetical protein
MRQVACALGVYTAILGPFGCEALLHVDGLTERPLDDSGVYDEVAISVGDAGGLVEAQADGGETDGAAGESDGPPIFVASANNAEDEGPDDSTDATLSARDGTSPAPDDASPAPDDASTMESEGAVSNANSGVDASDSDGSPTDGGVVGLEGPPEATYGSCLEILDAAPTSSSANYTIALGGSSLEVYCDMNFAGGGWTLVESTNGGDCTPATETAGTVALGSCTYMPSAALTALARGSTTVHVRTASGSAPPLAYITSATALPIQNLRIGLITNANEPVGDPVAEEAAWTVVGDPANAVNQGRTPQSILAFSCSVAGETWPAVYRACGNGADGFVLDVVDNVAFWNWGITPHVNIAMEVYVR